MKHFKKNKLYYITFLVCLIVISIFFYLKNIVPFGKQLILVFDLFHQYTAMLGEFYDRVKEGSSLIYSFRSNVGIPYIKTFMNYLSSPFNLLLFLFKRKHLAIAVSLIIGLKLAGSATTMVYYLSKKFNNKTMILIPLGILYAFCAWTIAFYWNLMWLDGLMMLPLIIYGIERLIDKGEYLFYIINLVIILIANYYMGFMICLFSVLYFLAYLVLKTDEIKFKVIIRKCLLFDGSSLLAGGIVAGLLLPLYYGLSVISATADVWPSNSFYNFTFVELLVKHFTGIGSSIFSVKRELLTFSDAPNVAIGILGIALVFLFFINPKIKLKIKLVYLFLLLFLIISFFLPSLDFIWHGFHIPNDLPYRYSFIYSFILIIISAYSLLNLEYIKLRVISLVYLFLLIAVSLLKIFQYQNVSNLMIVLNQAFITGYFIIYLLYRHYPAFKKIILYSFVLLVITECTLVFYNLTFEGPTLDVLGADYSEIQAGLDWVKQNDQTFYRIEKNQQVTFNDSAWYNYKSIAGFNSMAYENIAKLHEGLGAYGNGINMQRYEQYTPVYDLMFNIKYLIDESKDLTRYSLFYNENELKIYQNEFHTGLMYAVNSEIKNWQRDVSPILMQNDYIEKATGIKDVFKKLEPINKKSIINQDQLTVIKYTFKNPGDNLYLYINADNVDHFILNDVLYFGVYPYLDLSKNFNELQASQKASYFFGEKRIINTKANDEEFDLYIVYRDYQEDAYELYVINQSKFTLAANAFQNNVVKLTAFKEHYIKGEITIAEDMTIYTSIPYDDGWQVLVDGKPIETFKIGNALLGFYINSGKHEIILKYLPKGLLVGSIISFSSSLVLIYLIHKRTSRVNLELSLN